MSVVGPSIPEYEYYPDAPPAAVGILTSGQTATIEVWKDGVVVPLTSDVCAEIGDTGKFTWSMNNLPKLTKTRQQYHWRMTDSAAVTDEGDFILQAIFGMADMPSLTDPSSYLVTH